jgi:phage terminase large subunit GpA-like protein
VSQWADRYRRLSPEASAEPGRWDTDRAPYQRAIMDAISDPAIRRIVVMKSSQIGWTEIILNALGYYMHQDPGPVLLMQPTLETASKFSKNRLAPMVRDTPELSRLVQPARARDSGNTLLVKEFPGGHVTIVGANAPSALASTPIRIVLCDEIDRYPVSSGMEGDPISLAQKRQETYWNRKMLVGSTPTIKGLSPVEAEFAASDQRYLFVPCPHCGEEQTLKWPQVTWEKTEDGDHIPESALYTCEHCGALWDDVERWNAVKLAADNNNWRASRPFDGIAGFHINALYSPFFELARGARDFLEAKDRPEKLQVFVNTVLGESWEESAARVNQHELADRRENYSWQDIPSSALVLTAGIDVQDDRLELEIVGWAAGEQSLGVRYEVIHGDPAGMDVWDQLERMLFQLYQLRDNRQLRVSAACIDAGGHHGDSVYRFANRHWRSGVRAIRGRGGAHMVWPKRASKAKGNNTVFMVGVDTAKDTVYGRLRFGEPGPGYCRFPNDYDEQYFAQLTAERRVQTTVNGRPVIKWICPPGKRNEALDCRVYAYAAFKSLNVELPPFEAGIEDGESFGPQSLDPAPAPPQPVQRPGKRTARRVNRITGREKWI